jgi:CRP-like cAMP-binding protein
VREQLLRSCLFVKFPAGEIICAAGERAEHAFFINSGIVSLSKAMEDGKSVEVGAIGVEGFTGLYVGRGFDDAIVDYMVQVPATAFQINRLALHEAMTEHDVLRSLIEKYLQLLVKLIVQSAACNRLHSLEQRCCRLLLAAHDSAFSDSFFITHEFLASQLGVRRPSVTATAIELQRRRLIDYRHGCITIQDRRILESASCECYRVIRNEIDAFFG